MRAIFDSATRDGRFRITFGNDPALVFPAAGGTIAVDGEWVEIWYRRGIWPFQRQYLAMPGWARSLGILFSLSVIPLLIWLVAVSREAELPAIGGLILILVLEFGSLFPWIPRRMRLSRSTIMHATQHGKRITFSSLDPSGKRHLIDIVFQTVLDAERCISSLTETHHDLATPLPFNTWHEPVYPLPSYVGKHYLVGEGSITIGPESITLTGTRRTYHFREDAGKWKKLTLGMAMLLLISSFVTMVLACEYGSVDFSVVVMCFIGAFTVLLIPSYFVSHPIRWSEDSVTFTVKHGEVYRYGSVYKIRHPSGVRDYLYLLTESPEDQERLTRLLKPGHQPEEEMTFSVRFTPMYYHDIHGGFFDAGILAVEGEEITLVGRRGDTRPNGRGFWLTSGLVYAGLVSTAWVFYPVLGGAMIPPEYRLTVVLFVPLAAQLLATVVVLGVLPLVVEQWQTYHRSEIREVARRWRQVAFTVMDDRDRPVRQTFYTRTEAEAAAVEGVLRGVAPVG